MKFSKQYPKLAFSVTRPPSVTPSNSFSQRILSCFAALFSLRGKLSRAYPVCLTYSPILINMFNMLQFTLSFLSLLLLLVLLACFFHRSSTSVSAFPLALSLSQYFSTVLLCEYVSLRRSLLAPFQFFLFHASPSSFFTFVISYVPTSEFSRFLFVCVFLFC